MVSLKAIWITCKNLAVEIIHRFQLRIQRTRTKVDVNNNHIV